MRYVFMIGFLLFLIIPLSHITVVYSQRTPSEALEWWKQNYLSYKVADSNMTHPGGGDGAKLKSLYVYWDNDYLYLALDTANTKSWNIAYGFKLDIVPGGYNNTVFTRDSWGRTIAYNGSKYGIDYEVYFWWDENNGITSACLDIWKNVTGYEKHWEGWTYKCGEVFPGLYSTAGTPGSNGNGLQVLWAVIPWSALGLQAPKMFYIHAVLAGGDNSASVDSIPYDPEVVYQWTGVDQVYQNLLPIPEPGVLVAVATSATALGLMFKLRRK